VRRNLATASLRAWGRRLLRRWDIFHHHGFPARVGQTPGELAKTRT